MNYFNFVSQTRPNEIGYRVEAESEFAYNFRGCCRWAKMYMTYGDGQVQHSAETPFARELLPDFLGSLANAIAAVEEPARRQMLEIVSKHWPRHPIGKAKIRFALSLKCNEKKTQYYNVQECKVSTAESKKNDRRWEVIKTYDTHVDGSIPSAAAILQTGNAYDDIYAIQAYQEIEEVYREDNDGYSPFKIWEHFGLKGDASSRHGWTETAWQAVSYFVQSHRLAEDAANQARRWAEYGIAREEVKATA